MSCLTSMTPAVWLRNTRKRFEIRTSIDDGWISVNEAFMKCVDKGRFAPLLKEPPDDLDDASKLSRLTERLVAELASDSGRRYTDDQVKKFLGGNALAMLLNGWGT